MYVGVRSKVVSECIYVGVGSEVVSACTYVGVGSEVVSTCMQHSDHLLTSQTTANVPCKRVL